MSRSSGRLNRSAFTLVELLVVIAIIGILVSLLLPAVQSARESGRRAQCQNNLKQIMLALHTYHDSTKLLPPAVSFDANEDVGVSDKLKPNWLIWILPFMEKQNIYDQFNFSKLISDPANRAPRGYIVPTFLCPTDPGSNDPPFIGSSSGEGDNWARGCYAANAVNQYARGTPDGNEILRDGWNVMTLRGVMGVNRSLSLTQVTDGLTNTMFVGEIRVGLSPEDRRGSWALGTGGASALFKHGINGDDNGPNNACDPADDIEGCEKVYAAVGEQRIRRQKLTCYNKGGGAGSWQQAPRSVHPGGVQIGMGDGSVRFLSDTVETSGCWGTTLKVWDHLINSSAGTPFAMP